MKIRRSKHVEDKKKLIKTLILKSSFCWLTLHNYFRNYSPSLPEENLRILKS